MLWNAGALQGWGRARFYPATLTALSLAALGVIAFASRWQTAALYQWQYALVALATAEQAGKRQLRHPFRQGHHRRHVEAGRPDDNRHGHHGALTFSDL